MEQEVRENIRETITDGTSYMKRVNKNISLIVDALSSKKNKEITKNYTSLNEGLNWLLSAMDNFKTLIGEDYEKIAVGKQSSDKVYLDYKKFVEEFDAAYKKGNYTELSEMCSKDIPKYFKKITSLFNKILETLNMQEH